jgi:ParB-like chromosome segregation protein Spo0J
MKVQQIKIDKLIPYENNPRVNEFAVDAVMESIKRFGFRNPILVDKDMVIIAGHTRLWAARMLNLDSVPVHIAKDLDEDQVRQLRIADNKTAELAEWDDQKLADEIRQILEHEESIPGFTDEEIENLIQDFKDEEGIQEEQPEIEFSQEMLESNNYIVLVFNNDVDWLSALTHFKLKSVYSKRQNGKPWSKGIGRVVDGASYLDKLTNEIRK